VGGTVSPILEVRELHVSFTSERAAPVDVVRGVSLAVTQGQRLGLAGESGCGKSTTLLAMMGLLPANATVSGQVLLDGTDILGGGEDSMRPHRWKDIAMVFQGAMNAFNPVQTVGHQIVEAMTVHGRPGGKAGRQRAKDLLDMVGIPADRIDHYPHEFSGGMRQRAALAMALANDPRVLLADEPTTALDVLVQAQIIDLLERLTVELGLALVLVTHDLPLVSETCDSIAVMYAGQVVERGETGVVHHASGHPYTRRLFAAVPELYAQTRVLPIPGSPPRLDEHRPGCDFVPRCVLATDVCFASTPPEVELAAGHVARCHFATQVGNGLDVTKEASA